MIVQTPSEDFPPPPGVRLEIPDDWLGNAFAGSAALVVHEADDDGPFRTNVIVRHSRVPAPSIAAAYLDNLIEELQGQSQVRSTHRLDGEITGCVIVHESIGDAESRFFVQLLVVTAATPTVSHLTQVTGTTERESDIELLTRIVRSVRVLPA